MKLNQAMHQDVDIIGRVGRSITSVLDLDRVLKRIVEAAVELTGAEEGSVLLVDKVTGELYMRSAQNFNDEFVRTFRLPVQDSLAGKVLRNGKPILINQDRTPKIKNANLVRSLIYVPLKAGNKVIGVLGVDNRERDQIFNENHVIWISTLADYAAIAIENASLYSHAVAEQIKLEKVLDYIEDGVIVINHELELLYVNKVAKFTFGLAKKNLIGEPFITVFKHPDIIELVGEEDEREARRAEIEFDDGRVFNASLTPIPDIGYAISIQDISYLMELNRIKSDYVNAVSHDLRSPLTSILGYVELIERAGKINDKQKEFIDHVKTSVLSITEMITVLLDLGRIESGLDVNKEIISMIQIIRQVCEEYYKLAHENQQKFKANLPEDLPLVLGNPTRMRQMLGNLIGNAIKYTPSNGKIIVRARAEQDQVFIQVIDNGPGIPPSEQQFIFDKFYRASNISPVITGAGLGLAIVKSIVENHQGRIWVDSRVGKGTMFTVVLPVESGGIEG